MKALTPQDPQEKGLKGLSGFALGKFLGGSKAIRFNPHLRLRKDLRSLV